LPLRILRLAKTAAAISLASAPLIGLSVPAFAASAPPHAQPAMGGAQPRHHPVAPMVAGSGSVIMHEINGDAGASGLLLLILLVPITMYGLVIRQRDRRGALAPAAPAGFAPADPMLEFFAPEHARPPAARSGAGPSGPASPGPGLTGRSTMSTPLTGRSAFEVTDFGVTDAAAPRSLPAGPPQRASAGSAGTTVRQAYV
jgi:hypothetical protein